MKHTLPSLTLLILCAASVPVDSTAQDAPKEAVYIIFDASGSMWGALEDRSLKVTVAKQVLLDFVAGDFEGYDLALRAYGHRRKADCDDTELVVNFGAPDQVIPQVRAFTEDLNPLGKTPISRSLRAALDDFGDRQGEIILISDGIETCDEDPCALVRSWRDRGIAIKVHVVGLGLDEKEKQAMQCISDAAGTTFQDAESAAALAEGLRRIQEEARVDLAERAATVSLRLIGTDMSGRRVRVRGIMKRDGDDRYEVSSNRRNVVEAGSYALVAGVPTRNGTVYQPVTVPVDVAETGETTIAVEVPLPPSVYTTFVERGEIQRGSLVRAYQNGIEAFSMRAIDTVYVEPGTYDFQTTPNAENELSVTETVDDGEVQQVLFRMVHTVRVTVKMVATGSGIWFRQNYELWQNGKKKYGVHVTNGADVLPGTYELRLPHKVALYRHGEIVITDEDAQHFEIDVPVGHVTVAYQKVDGTPDANKRCFVGAGPEGSGAYHNAGQRYPLVPGTYNVAGWRGNYDRVVFEVVEGEDITVVLRDKG